jgi:hypothetical protein
MRLNEPMIDRIFCINSILNQPLISFLLDSHINYIITGKINHFDN